MNKPTVVAINMGYGHLRPAHALARLWGAPVYEADAAPMAAASEQRRWATLRHGYELTSRLAAIGGIAAPARAILDRVTRIAPLHPRRDLSAPSAAVKVLRRHAARGLGAALVVELRRTGSPLVTTFFAPALLADFHGYRDIFALVTDSDCHRIWAPFMPRASNIRYLAPSPRVRERLLAYGVPAARIHLTGYPLPNELLGGPELPVLLANLAARLVRLDPYGVFRQQLGAEVERRVGPLPKSEGSVAPHVAFAIGGAGAQVDLAVTVLRGLRAALIARTLTLTLVAGIRTGAAAALARAVDEAGLAALLGGPLSILSAPTLETYFDAFNAMLARTDILWTKPSELTFFGGLGLALVLAPPIGAHEQYNRRWAVENGAAIVQRDPRHAGEWLTELLADGTLAYNAWSGFLRLPNRGLYAIDGLLGGG